MTCCQGRERGDSMLLHIQGDQVQTFSRWKTSLPDLCGLKVYHDVVGTQVETVIPLKTTSGTVHPSFKSSRMVSTAIRGFLTLPPRV